MKMTLRVVAHFLAAGCEARPRAPSEPPSFQHSFERAQEWTRQFEDPERDAWQEPARVMAGVRIEAGMTVVEVGEGWRRRLERAPGTSNRISLVLSGCPARCWPGRRTGRVAPHCRPIRVRRSTSLRLGGALVVAELTPGRLDAHVLDWALVDQYVVVGPLR